MKLQRPRISSSIDADLAIGVIDRNIGALAEEIAPVQTSVVFNGMHERTAKGDELVLTVSSSTKRTSVKYQLKRDSFYHILPEYLFHPLDRYSDCDGDKEAFMQRRSAQKKIEDEAKEYFHPYDKALNDLRVRFQNHLNDSILGNEAFIIDFITENSDVNKANPFIRACLPCILGLRANRGSASLLTQALKMTFGSQMCEYDRSFVEVPVMIQPDSCHISLDGSIDDLFCGDHFMDWIEFISVKYQTSIKSSEDISRITSELEEFSSFFRRWFLADNQMIDIHFGDFRKEPVISDNTADGYLFLNYNTQLLVS